MIARILERLLRSGDNCLMLALAALVAGCSKEQIRVYRVPKEEAVVASQEATDQALASPPQLEWKLPSGWEERGPGRMSIASFWVSGAEGQGAEVSVMRMPGESASNLSLLANIVRLGAGMEPLDDGEVTKLVEDIKIGDATSKLIDLTASDGAGQENRIVLAVLTRAGTTWLFKIAGSTAVVSAQKGMFLDFLKSITFRQADGRSIAAAGLLPGADSAGGTGGVPATPKWEVPQGWQQVPPSQLLVAKFQIGSNAGRAEVTVSTFTGEVGGLPANVNRWRGQVGLAPVPPDEAERLASPLDVLGGKGMLVEMSGDKGGQKSRLIGVIVPREGQTWFYKLLGDDAVAEREKSAFLKFVQSVRYPNA